jgi:gamma-glutamyltranspeptidase/glutathione hydrolase
MIMRELIHQGESTKVATAVDTGTSWRDKSPVPFDTFKQSATGMQGMVVTNHPQGSAAGAQILAMGGNAIDAAIASVFALSVCEPAMVGPFGAGFINILLASGESVVIDNYATSPGAATPDLYTPLTDDWPWYMKAVDRKNDLGYLSVATPGNLKAWVEALEGWGTLDLETVMRPAISLAENGFPATRYLVETIEKNANDMSAFPATTEVFLPGGNVPAIGQLIFRRDYAQSLRTIAVDGAAAMYTGELAQAIVDDVQRNGGILSMDDLANYETKRREVVRGTYRGHEILGVPPTSAGGTHIIQMLNILEEWDIGAMGFGSPDAVHLTAEALRIAFADRFVHMGDPDAGEIPVEWLTSKSYAAERRTEIDMARAGDYTAGDPQAGEGSHTTHLNVADAEGNVVSMTQTINDTFGSKVTVPGTGMLLNNNMSLFDPHPGHTNSVAPRKRPLSSMSPTIVTKDGKPFMAIGTPGAKWIFPTVCQAIVNVIDHGMSIQEAVEAPRVWTQGQELELEASYPHSVFGDLAGRGHIMCSAPRIAGGMSGITFDQSTGVMEGGGCWRADGTAIGLGGGDARPGSGWGSLAG